MLYRYTLRHDVLQIYNLNQQSVRDWLEQHHPGKTGFHPNPIGFDVLDDAVVNILAHVPDDARYWTPADDGRQRYRKLP